MFQLRPEQRKTVDQGKHILKQFGILYLAAEVRTGKNVMSMTIAREGARRVYNKVLFATKKGAISGVESDLKMTGYKFEKFKITNFEQLKNEKPLYDLIIVDEAHSCFPTGTLIDGIKIEDIKVGHFLKSYNFTLRRIEQRVVINKIQVTNGVGWVKVHVFGVDIICTSDHLFYSKRGWIQADQITESDELFTMRNETYRHSDKGSIKGWKKIRLLFKVMLGRITKTSFDKSM